MRAAMGRGKTAPDAFLKIDGTIGMEQTNPGP
jgi:hypothetical protein